MGLGSIVIPPADLPRDEAPPGLSAGSLFRERVKVGRLGGQCHLACLLADMVLWAVAFALCFGALVAFRNGSALPNLSVVFIPATFSLLAAWLVGAYDNDTDFLSLRFASESLIAGAVATFLGAGTVVLFGSFGLPGQPSRFLLLAAPLVFSGLSVVARRVVRHRKAAQLGTTRIVVLGDEKSKLRLDAALRLRGRVCALTHLDPRELSVETLEQQLCTADLGAPDACCAASCWPSALVLAPEVADRLDSFHPLLASLHVRGIPVYSWQSFWTLRLKMLDVSNDPVNWLFAQDFPHLQHSVFGNLKRLMDVVLAVTALAVTAPLCALVWLAIRLESPGPGVFCQTRIGFRGEEFTIFKFRTMRVDSEKDGSTTAANDPRITRLGNILRRTRIDEIPQFLNVLRGEMSVVGPRPEWTPCVAAYEDKLPGYHLRHLAKPGITGWAQVNYPYGQDLKDAARKLAFDLHYVTHASPSLDVSILLKTIYVVLGRAGGR